MPTKNLTLPDLIDRFASEDACRAYLERLRWPDGVRCLRCESTSVSTLKKRNQYDCNACRHRFSVRAGTIFHDSKLPLRRWFLAIFIMAQSKKGVSAKQLERMLGVTYKTAWFLCHRIRKAMEEENPSWLSGTVEVDETYIGGRTKGNRDKFKRKSIVAAAVQRGGKVRLRVVKDRSEKSLRRFIDDHVHDKTKAIYTDGLRSYAEIGNIDTDHKVVTHRKEEWVHGTVHTNTVEGVFSLLDRAILGAYHKVSKKHLPAYLHEVEWKYNNRSNPYLFRDTVLELVRAERLEYKKLTA